MQQQVRDGLSVALPAVLPPAVFNLHGKGEFSLPCLPTKCFCFALAFALMKLFSFWYHISGKDISKHKSHDDSISVGW